METPIVLFVDDEANILKTLNRLFLDEDYDVHTALGGQKALELIDSGITPTVIVSDQRMPEMSGAEFLEKAKEKVPQSIRMVLTGYADINAAVDAINLGGIYRYILKPWNDEDLILTVREAVDRFRLVEENKRLTNELHEKNKILAEINKHLEEKVDERTKELRQKVKELKGRDRIQQHLVTIHPLQESLDLVAEVISDVITPQWTAIYIAENDNGDLQQKVVTPDDIHLNEENILWVTNDVVAEKTPKSGLLNAIFSTGAEMQDAYVSALPIKTENKTYGVLLVSSVSQEGFNQEQERTLTVFCEQAAMAAKDAEMADSIPEMGTNLDSLLDELA